MRQLQEGDPARLGGSGQAHRRPVPRGRTPLLRPDGTRHRATTRTVDIPGLPLPTWQDITQRAYDPWDRPHLTLDTAGKPPEHTITELTNTLGITP
ncbi:hypothetical protein ACFQVA_34725 [Actinomadura keratinilytica]